MKIEQVRKIKSIESEFLKLSKNENVKLTVVGRNYGQGFFGEEIKSLVVSLGLFDEDIGKMEVRIDAKSRKQIENLQVILEMLQGSV